MRDRSGKPAVRAEHGWMGKGCGDGPDEDLERMARPWGRNPGQNRKIPFEPAQGHAQTHQKEVERKLLNGPTEGLFVVHHAFGRFADLAGLLQSFGHFIDHAVDKSCRTRRAVGLGNFQVFVDGNFDRNVGKLPHLIDA